jgi:AcrR family transcriptional regulator
MKPARSPSSRTSAAVQDRRSRILDAALTEFAERGFVSASTNAIAERAGVAKGLVFHHFSEKDALFLAVVDSITGPIERYFEHTFAHAMADAPRDLIGRILVLLEKKHAFVRDEPRIARFLILGLADAPPALRKKARALLQPPADLLWAKLLAEVDVSTLRVPLGEAVEAIMIFSAGIEKRNEALTDTLAKAAKFDVEEAMAHSRRLLELLRTGLYR